MLRSSRPMRDGYLAAIVGGPVSISPLDWLLQQLIAVCRIGSRSVFPIAMTITHSFLYEP